MSDVNVKEETYFLNRMNTIRADANRALSELNSILKILREYNIQGLNGVNVSFSSSIPQKDVGEKVVEVKYRIKILIKTYSRSFPSEFKYLNPELLYKYKCYLSKYLLTSVDLVKGVNLTIEAMNKKLLSIEEQYKKIESKINEGPLHDNLMSQFYSQSSARLVDSLTTEEQVTANFEKNRELRDQKTKNALNDYMVNEIAKESHTTEIGINLVALGLSPLPVSPVSKAVSDFNMSIMSAQFPKSFTVCDNDESTRLKKLQDDWNKAKTETSGTITAIKDALGYSDISGETLGIDYLKTSHYKALENDFYQKVSVLNSNGSSLFATRVTNQFNSKVLSIKKCTDAASLNSLIKELSSIVSNAQSSNTSSTSTISSKSRQTDSYIESRLNSVLSSLRAKNIYSLAISYEREYKTLVGTYRSNLSMSESTYKSKASAIITRAQIFLPKDNLLIGSHYIKKL